MTPATPGLPAELTAIRRLPPEGGGQPQGVGFRPAFHALWHLRRLGVTDSLESFRNAHWDAAAAAGRPVRVAVLDTPVAWHHPNLHGAIDRGLMRDFSVHDAGVFVLADPGEEGLAARRALAETIRGRQTQAGEGAPDLSPMEAAILAEVDGTDDRPPCAPLFPGAHGTAVAGLIGARPVRTRRVIPEFHGGETLPADRTADLFLPYAGINPHCRIVPVSTAGAPDPAMIRASLDYTLLIGAEVVVIAAAWEDTALYGTEAGRARWAGVDEALRRLCATAVVLCAAGNSGDTGLAYPACLSRTEGGPLAVTACDAAGTVVAYAPAPKPGDRILMTLSGAAERYDRGGLIRDPWEAADPLVVRPEDAPLPGAVADLPAESLISLDVPGPFGYNPSPFAYAPPEGGPHLEIGSLYCTFSGTSAAAAVAAGLISLALQAQGAKQGTVAPRPIEDGGGLFSLPEAAALVGGGA